MELHLFSVYDSAAGAYLPPFHAPSIESAIRSFRHTVNNGENDISRYPEDYTLFHLGSFDQETGHIEALGTPHSLGVAITYQEKPVAKQMELLTPEDRYQGERKASNG